MALTRYVATRKRHAPRVSILRSKQIAINSTAVELYSLSEFSHAVPFYDDVDGTIGLLFTSNPEEPGSTKISKPRAPGGGYIISAFSFFNLTGMDMSETRRCSLSLDETTGVHVLVEQPR